MLMDWTGLVIMQVSTVQPLPYCKDMHCESKTLFSDFFPQLLESAMEQASELFRRNEDHELLSGLRAAGLEGEVQHAEQLTVQFAEHQEQLEEVWNDCHYPLLRRVVF